MPELTRIVAVVVDTRQLTLYKQDGSTIELPQGDARVQRVLDQVANIEMNGFAYIDLSTENPYREYEEKSGGLTRFFRVAKKTIAGIFAAPPADNTAPVGTFGDVPASVQHMSQAEAIEQIQRHAEPMSSPMASADLGDDHTIVAVTSDQKVIPHAEKLVGQIRASTKQQSAVGFENFLKRVGAVIEQRGHSVEDLLRFLERADLPIADDGCVIGYKVLRKRNGGFVDCHTESVPQRVGSVVQMDPKLVDPNRRNECSTGLHIARRGYLKSFSGDVCVLAKIAPEDFIAVPSYDSNKVRVCRYHILMELDKQMWDTLSNNRPITDEKAQKIIGRAVAGDHVGVFEYVTIGGPRGSSIVVTKNGDASQAVSAPKTASRKVEAIEDHLLDQKPTASDPKKDEAALTKAIKDRVPAPAKQPSARQQKAAELISIVQTSTDPRHQQKAAAELVALKKKSKVSWETLGLTDTQAKLALDWSSRTVEAPAEPKVKAAPAVKAAPKKKAKPASKVAPAPEPAPTTSGSRKQRLFDLDKVYNDVSKPMPERAAAALSLVAERKAAKKTWGALGYPKLTDQLLTDFATKATAAPVQKPVETKPAKITNLGSVYADTLAGRARKLFDEKKFGPLYDLKQRSKKSWTALGFTSAEQVIIVQNKP